MNLFKSLIAYIDKIGHPKSNRIRTKLLSQKKDGEPLLHTVISYNFLDIVHYLREKGASINQIHKIAKQDVHKNRKWGKVSCLIKCNLYFLRF